MTAPNSPAPPTLGTLDAGGIRAKVLDVVEQAVIITDPAGKNIRRDGTRFLAAVTNTPFHDDQGTLCAIIGVSFDITERANKEEQLRRSEARFRALASEAPVGVFEADATGRYGYFNAVAADLLGARPGDEWLESIHLEDRVRVRRTWGWGSPSATRSSPPTPEPWRWSRACPAGVRRSGSSCPPIRRSK